jgi:hypothetical protein
MAVALGIGAATATVTAGPASAAPDRSDTGSARAEQSVRGSRTSSTVRPPAEKPARSARRVVTPSVPRSAGAVVADVAIVAGGATAAGGVTAAPPDPSPSVPTVPQVRTISDRTTKLKRRPVRGAAAPEPLGVPPAAISAPMAWNPWADSRGRLITIYKGTHFVIPNQWALWVTEESGDATFTEKSTYDLKDDDQYDWNKLAGITFTPWRPDRNSGMVVWRYNLQSQMFEVGPFFNVDFAYVFPTADEVITVPPEQTFSYFVDYDGITVNYGDRTVFKPTPKDLVPNFWTSARVTGWFGGNRVAPRTISYYQHIN